MQYLPVRRRPNTGQAWPDFGQRGWFDIFVDYEAIFLDTLGLYLHGVSVLAKSTARLTQAVVVA